MIYKKGDLKLLHIHCVCDRFDCNCGCISKPLAYSLSHQCGRWVVGTKKELELLKNDIEIILEGK